MKSINFISTLLLCGSLCACDTPSTTSDTPSTTSDTPSTTSDTPLTTDFTLTDDNGGSAQVTVELPEGQEEIAISARMFSQATDVQKNLATYGNILPLDDYWSSFKNMPIPELFCQAPESEQFKEIAEKLGNFSKNYRIRIEKDAATPTVLTGFEKYEFDMAYAESTVADKAVAIQRPDIVHFANNNILYLSDIYGLIKVAVNEEDDAAVSCALPLPGHPDNMLQLGDNIYVLIKSKDRRSMAILLFDASSDQLQYKNSLFLENKTYVDARAFNDTLVIYVNAKDAQLPEIADSDEQNSLPYYLTPANYEMLVINSELELTNKEVFIKSDSTQTSNADLPRQEQQRTSSYFNSFVSASGEYLVVSENINTRKFTGYETKTYSHCDNYLKTETPYHYCRTNWKRVENPDYLPPKISGVLTCAGALIDCLKAKLPSVSRYMNIADGETCYDGIQTNYQCTAYSYSSYQSPLYDWTASVKLHLYRFTDNQFIRLDDKVATLEGYQIQVDAADLTLAGNIRKHDHIYFSGDNLYIINSQNELHNYSVQGNSIIYLNKLDLSSFGNSGENNAMYSEDNIYISSNSASYNDSHAVLNTISLADPLTPAINNSVTIPAKLDQLVLAENALIGVGKVKIGSGNNSVNIGNITHFSLQGDEDNSLLLGSDYQGYYSPVAYDDQVLSFDAQLNRLFMPYSVSNPYFGSDLPYNENRLTLADSRNSIIEEVATFSLPETAKRSVSVNEDLAYALSDSYIHKLSNDTAWQKKTLFDGKLPDSMYYSAQQQVAVQKYNLGNAYQFTLIHSSDGSASGNEITRLTLPKASSHVCLSQKIYFDQDRLLVIQEKANLYATYNDCYDDPDLTEVDILGYSFNENGFTEIADQELLADLYQLIKRNMHCVIDIANFDGEKVEALPEDVKPYDLTCYTREQYNQIRDNDEGNLGVRQE